jgi:S1-C subfamily serine protease
VAGAGGDSGGNLGLELTQLTPELQKRFNLQAGTGLVVTTVEAGSAADDAGIQPGDVVTAVNRNPVDSIRDYRGAVEATRPGKPVLFQIDRGGNTFFAAVRPE